GRGSDTLGPHPPPPTAGGGSGAPSQQGRGGGSAREAPPRPPATTGERTARERTAARRTGARERAAAAAGRFRHRALCGNSRRRPPLYRDGGNVLAVRPIGRALGGGLLHRLCREKCRSGEPSRHLRLQRRTGRGIGVTELGSPRPAHYRVS